MDVSIHKFRPGAGNGARLLSIPVCCALVALLLGTLVVSLPAHGYSVQRVGSNGTIRLRPDDISQAGMPLGRGAEQVFDQGTVQENLVDFSQPVAVNLDATVGSTALTALVDRNQAFVVRLTRAERNQCLTEADFEVSIRAVSPVNAFASQSGGGALDVLDFVSVYRDRQGGNCPSHLFYGYQLLLGLDSAMAAGVYGANVEFSVTQLGGGPVETLQTPVMLDMPGFLLLYLPTQIQIDLQATAIAGVFGATTVCGVDGCLDLGSRSLTLSTLGAPVPVGIDSAVPTATTLQTVTLRDAVGARATGCTTGSYDTATYQIVNATGGIQPGSGPITGLQGTPCGLNLSTGDLQFDLDLGQAAATGASATIQITVTGI